MSGGGVSRPRLTALRVSPAAPFECGPGFGEPARGRCCPAGEAGPVVHCFIVLIQCTGPCLAPGYGPFRDGPETSCHLSRLWEILMTGPGRHGAGARGFRARTVVLPHRFSRRPISAETFRSERWYVRSCAPSGYLVVGRPAANGDSPRISLEGFRSGRKIPAGILCLCWCSASREMIHFQGGNSWEGGGCTRGSRGNIVVSV